MGNGSRQKFDNGEDRNLVECGQLFEGVDTTTHGADFGSWAAAILLGFSAKILLKAYQQRATVSQNCKGNDKRLVHR